MGNPINRESITWLELFVFSRHVPYLDGSSKGRAPPTTIKHIRNAEKRGMTWHNLLIYGLYFVASNSKIYPNKNCTVMLFTSKGGYRY